MESKEERSQVLALSKLLLSSGLQKFPFFFFFLKNFHGNLVLVIPLMYPHISLKKIFLFFFLHLSPCHFKAMASGLPLPPAKFPPQNAFFNFFHAEIPRDGPLPDAACLDASEWWLPWSMCPPARHVRKGSTRERFGYPSRVCLIILWALTR